MRARPSRRLARAHRHTVQGDQREEGYRDSEGNVVGDQPSCLGTWRQTTQHAAAKLRDDCLSTGSSTTRPSLRDPPTPRAVPSTSSIWRPHQRSRFHHCAGRPGQHDRGDGDGGARRRGRLHTAVRALRRTAAAAAGGAGLCETCRTCGGSTTARSLLRLAPRGAREHFARRRDPADVTAEQAEAKFRALRAVRPPSSTDATRRSSVRRRPSSFSLTPATWRARAQPGRPPSRLPAAPARCDRDEDGVLGWEYVT